VGAFNFETEANNITLCMQDFNKQREDSAIAILMRPFENATRGLIKRCFDRFRQAERRNMFVLLWNFGTEANNICFRMREFDSQREERAM
jgi:hypothetical protein